jgi:hypothetical protein
MKRFPLVSMAGALLLFAACATIGPPQPPSLDLPKPPADLRAVRKGDRVILTWTIPSVTTDRQTVHSLGPTRICRASGPEMKQCGTAVGEVQTAVPNPSLNAKQKLLGSYTDALPAALETDSPASEIFYAVDVLNRDGRSAGLSNRVNVRMIRTLPAPQGFQARVTSQGVVLSWIGERTTPQEGIHYVYRVYRGREGQERTLLAELPFGDEHIVTLTDSEIEWERNYQYTAETVTVIAEKNKPDVQVEGEETPPVKVFADDVFPPAVPSGLQAAFSGPGQQPFIDLAWAPGSDADLAGYNVYRHTEGSSSTKLNGELIRTPAYRDGRIESGKKYFYSVTAVDERGNESARSDEASEAAP